MNIYDNSATLSYFSYLWGYQNGGGMQFQSSTGVQTGFDFFHPAGKICVREIQGLVRGVETRVKLLKIQTLLANAVWQLQSHLFGLSYCKANRVRR